MNQIDCAVEKSAIDAALPSRKRRPSASIASSRCRYAASAAAPSCGGARRSDGVIAARSAPNAFRYSGGAPAKMSAAPTCMV
jgi:hypothetical protein